VVAILALRGYDGQRRAAAWQGRHDLNSVAPDYALPLLTVSAVQPAHELVCLVHTGGPLNEPALLAELVRDVVWDADGTVRVVWADGEAVTVPALPRNARNA
jgi:hypothetical protein